MSKDQDKDQIAFMATWIEVVGQDKIDRIADLVAQTPIVDFPSFRSFCQLVTSEVIRGTIPVFMAEELRGWAEIMLATVTAEVAPQTTGALDSVAMLAQAIDNASKRPAIEPAYNTTLIDVTEDAFETTGA